MGGDGKPTQPGYEFLQRLEKLVREANAAIAALQAVSNAPAAAQYLTLALHAGLSAERRLVAGTGISITDGGANGDATIANTLTSGGVTIIGAQGNGGGTTYTRASLAASKLLEIYLNGISHNGGGTQALTVEVSSNGGTNWSTAVTVSAALGAAVLLNNVIMISTDGSTTAYIAAGGPGALGGGVTIGGGGTVIDAIRLGWTPGGVNFDAGTINTIGIN